MNIVGHMLVYNEADIIAESLADFCRWGVRTICVLDGGSDDGTLEAIDEFSHAHPDVTIDLRFRPDPEGKFADHYRNELLAMTAEHSPHWVISKDPDEKYHTSPVEAILRADAYGANVVMCQVPQFWVTLADLRDGFVLEDESVSIEKRRLWYSWGHVGRFIWKWDDEHYYPTNVQKRTPELPGLEWRDWQLPGPLAPICKHYCYRSLAQIVKRTEARQKRGGRKYFGKYFEAAPFIDEAWCGLAKFNGDWCTTPTHDRVSEWFKFVRGNYEARGLSG